MGLNDWVSKCHRYSFHAGWWDAPKGLSVPYTDWIPMVTPTKLALIHSETSEALEGFRKNLMDDHLPHRKMAEVELADVLIRVFDLAGAHGFDLEGALAEKMAYNLERADHKRENRAKEGGKKF